MALKPAPILVISPSLAELHLPDAAGHAAWHLARRLRAEGADCSLLVPRGPDGTENITEHWGQMMQAGIPLHVLPQHDGADGMLGWRCVEWLRGRPAPGMVIVIDQRGIGESLGVARHMGMVLAGVPIITLVTGAAGWAATGQDTATPFELLREHRDMAGIAAADARLFIHPSLAQWWGTRDDKPGLVCGALGDAGTDPALPGEHLLPVPPRHPRAVARIAAWRQAHPTAALRIGIPRNMPQPGRDPIIALFEALEGAHAGIRLGLPPEPGRQRRMLPAGATILLADAADLGEPLVQDALAAGLSVLAPDADGALTPLAPSPPVPALLPFLRSIQAPPPATTKITGQPLVSVCISHFDRPTLLAQTLDSLRAQTWPHLEVVLVDDASPSRATREFLDAQEADFAARGWRIIRNERELWQSASRNLAARESRGEFILIMDDDNLAHPHEVETMLRALQNTGADAAAALQDLFVGEHDALADPDPMLPRVEFFPSGGPADVGLAWNIYGDVNVMFRREAFLALGGYTDEPELGCEDYELGAALVASGRQLLIIPQALYLYRFSSVNMAKGMSNERLYWSHRRPLRPPSEGLDDAARRVLALVHGAEHATMQRQGWSYWAGRPESRPLPEEGIEDPSLPGADFLFYAAVAALRAGDPGPALRMLAAAREPRALRLLHRAEALQAAAP